MNKRTIRNIFYTIGAILTVFSYSYFMLKAYQLDFDIFVSLQFATAIIFFSAGYSMGVEDD
jgi:hypothetical protein